MRRFFAPLLALVAGLSGPAARIAAPAAVAVAAMAPKEANAYEKLLGVITSTGTSVNNSTTAVPFTVGSSLALVSIQCDAAACIAAGSGSSTAASCTAGNASQGTRIEANQLFDVPLAHVSPNAVDTLAVISVSGTANCTVYQVVTGP